MLTQTLSNYAIIGICSGVITSAMEDAKSELEAERLADAEADGDVPEKETATTTSASESSESDRINSELETKFAALAVIFREIASDILQIKENEKMRNAEIEAAETTHEETSELSEQKQNSLKPYSEDLDNLIRETEVFGGNNQN